jgi:O-antigen/teichoic acid export membrane protein
MYGPLFQGTGRPDVITRLKSAELALLVIMIYPLTRFFGIEGTAWTVLLSFAAISPFANFLAIKKIQARAVEFIKPLAFSAVAMLLAVLPIWFVKGFAIVKRFDIAAFFILAIAGCALYYFLTWLMCRFSGYKMPTKTIIHYLSNE